MRFLFFVTLSVAFALAAGCKGPCQSLSDKICKCAGNSQAETQCQQQVAQYEVTYSRTAEQEEYCKSLLDVCDCTKLDTAEGKKNCGLTDP